MRIINVIQLLNGSVKEVDSFPVYCEENDEMRFQVEKFCEKLLSTVTGELILDFDDYFDSETDSFSDDNGYEIVIVSSYIYG